MVAEKEITRLEKSNVRLSLTIPKDDVRAKYQEMLKEYAGSVQLPGFRKGKVPQQVLERKFADALKSDAVSRIIESALTDVFGDENMPRSERPLPYSTPRLDDEPTLDFEQDLKFSVVYDVLPEVKVGKWKGLEAEIPKCEVDKEDIDRELEAIRERNAIVLDRDEGAKAAGGDVVTVDYRILEENGEVLSGNERKDFVFTLGSKENIYQFDDEITGMKKGDTKEFEKTFPADFMEPSLAGNKKKFQLSLTSLKEKKLPDLDDELAQDVDEKYKTLADLKNSITERLNKNLEKKMRDIKIDRLLQIITGNTPVVLPDSMVRMEIENRWRKLGRLYGMNADDIMKLMAQSGKGPDDIENEWRASAEKALHSRLIVETLMEEQNFEITEEDMEGEYSRIAADNDVDIEEIKERYREDNMKEYLREEIKEYRLFNIILAENTLKTGKKEKYLDLIRNNG